MKQRLLLWWRDIRSGDLNPILVRELRQCTRGRFSSYVLVLMLAGLLVLTAGFFSDSGQGSRRIGTELGTGHGGRMYGAVATLLTLASILLALQTAQRMGSERQKEQPDLLYSTSLSPGTIVRGKLLAGLAMFGLLFSLAMPFMTMTYLLRGIDMRSILWGLLFLLVLNVLLQVFSVLAGCTLCVSRARRAGAMFVALLFGFWSLGIIPMLLFRHGRLLSPFTSLGIHTTVVAVACALLLTLFFLPYSLSVLVLSPKWSNRARPFRLTITGLCALWCALAVVAYAENGPLPMDVLGGFLLITSLALLLALQVGECSPQRASQRVQRTVPRSLLGRLVCFPFYAGQANSLVWCLGLLAGVYAVAYATIEPHMRWSRHGAVTLLVATIYAVCYVLSAGLLSRRLPERTRHGAGAPWLISLYFFAAAGIAPMLVESLYHAGKLPWYPQTFPGSVFAVLAHAGEEWREHMAVALPWLVLVVGLNLPRIMDAVSRFRRLVDDPPTAETAGT